MVVVSSISGQVVLSGKVQHRRHGDDSEMIPMTAVHVFGSLDGGEAETRTFRTWETHPAGWYRVAGPAGKYTVAFTTPAHFMRPVLRTNVFAERDERVSQDVSPTFQLFQLDERGYDRRAARAYYQPFVARGSSVTHVGIRLAHDGVDGIGPKGQDLVVSIHRQGEGSPESWEQVGPVGRVLEADVGGPKNPVLSVGWNSGEVPLVRGKVYAVCVRAAREEGRFQARWRATTSKEGRCYRVGEKEKGYVEEQLWLSVAGEGDGLVLPYHKRVHREYGALTRFGRRWVQTYVAQGQSLACVVLYAAVAGTQPPIYRQRVRVTVREGGPKGQAVGVSKIATGSGNYTGDASWGMFGVAFAPGEVPVEAGKSYAVEWESIETEDTIGGFINIKGDRSSGIAGFNPYRKHPLDDYAQGTAYFEGKDVGYDLDAQIVEYEHKGKGHERAVVGKEWLRNPQLQKSQEGEVSDWKTFTISKGIIVEPMEKGKSGKRMLRLRALPGEKAGAADGGLVQRVEGVEASRCYRLGGKVRCTFAVDEVRSCRVGIDPTGQTEDARAETIRWVVLPERHGEFVEFLTSGIRPRDRALSVWLRVQTPTGVKVSEKADARVRVEAVLAEFRADFADLTLREVQTSPPEK